VFGSSAHFALPPVLGGLPFFLGWGMCVILVKYWRLSDQLKQALPPAAPYSPEPLQYTNEPGDGM